MSLTYRNVGKSIRKYFHIHLDYKTGVVLHIVTCTVYMNCLIELRMELLLIMMIMTCYYLNSIIRYEVTSNKFTRDLYKELMVSLVASVFMGFGVVFLLLWVGIYV